MLKSLKSNLHLGSRSLTSAVDICSPWPFPKRTEKLRTEIDIIALWKYPKCDRKIFANMLQ